MTKNFHYEFREKKLKGLNNLLDDSPRNIKSTNGSIHENEGNKNRVILS